MCSQWLRTFGLVIVSIFCLVKTSKGSETVFLGYRWDPQWSPSGNLIGAWRGDTLVVFDVQSHTELKSIPVRRPKFCYWISEDTLALSSQSSTQAERPRDRWPIVTRSIITLGGDYREILRDTIADQRNSVGHLQRLPNGKVGAIQYVNDVRASFLELASGEFRAISAEVVDDELCPQKSPDSSTAWFPSLDCSRSLAYIGDRRLVILDSEGRIIRDIGARAEQLGAGKMMIVGRPFWSSDSKFLSFTEFIEDEWKVLSTAVIVVGAPDYGRTLAYELIGDRTLTASWSPSSSVLLLMSEGSLLLWQPGQ